MTNGRSPFAGRQKASKKAHIKMPTFPLAYQLNIYYVLSIYFLIMTLFDYYYAAQAESRDAVIYLYGCADSMYH